MSDLKGCLHSDNPEELAVLLLALQLLINRESIYLLAAILFLLPVLLAQTEIIYHAI